MAVAATDSLCKLRQVRLGWGQWARGVEMAKVGCCCCGALWCVCGIVAGAEGGEVLYACTWGSAVESHGAVMSHALGLPACVMHWGVRLHES